MLLAFLVILVLVNKASHCLWLRRLQPLPLCAKRTQNDAQRVWDFYGAVIEAEENDCARLRIINEAQLPKGSIIPHE